MTKTQFIRNCVNDWTELRQNGPCDEIDLRWQLRHTDLHHCTGKDQVKVLLRVFRAFHTHHIRFLLSREDGDSEETICGGQSCVLWGQLCWRAWENLQAPQNHAGPCQRVSDVSEAWFSIDQHQVSLLIWNLLQNNKWLWWGLWWDLMRLFKREIANVSSQVVQAFCFFQTQLWFQASQECSILSSSHHWLDEDL